MVREKEVREAESWPSSAGEGVGEEARVVRSLRIEVLWRRAELKRVFWVCFSLGGVALRVCLNGPL